MAAIAHGKHVAMVNKETDVIVGPILKHLADQAGVVYTAVEGDQHGLLIRLVTWARSLGLTVWCGGKSRDTGLIFDPGTQTLRHHEEVIPLDAEVAELFAPVPAGQAMAFTRRRLAWLGDLGAVGGYDLVELTIVANATGLVPDLPTLHHPVLRTAEIPEVLCPVEEGGILRNPGAIEVITHMGHPFGVGLGGGVFIVVGCANDYSRSILLTKGLVANRRNSAALIYRPYHLCGVETPTSIIGAASATALPEVLTGAEVYLPRFDVVARAAVDLKAGEVIGDDHSPKLEARIQPAQPVRGAAPVPLHMANGHVLAVDVPAGELVTVDMVRAPSESVLWDLRAQQDQRFLSEGDV
jgi:predicted homoserine dehydrogenase-like protein